MLIFGKYVHFSNILNPALKGILPPFINPTEFLRIFGSLPLNPLLRLGLEPHLATEMSDISGYQEEMNLLEGFLSYVVHKWPYQVWYSLIQVYSKVMILWAELKVVGVYLTSVSIGKKS